MIRIGTRGSQLALWQTRQIVNALAQQGQQSEVKIIHSKGDLDQQSSIQDLGGLGAFTKALDAALLRGEIDLAVHSLKDLPTRLPESLDWTSVLKRGAAADVLVHQPQKPLKSWAYGPATIATGSARRRAFWLHRYPRHEIVDLRGNVDQRLQKLQSDGWQGAIFAQAGLERLNLLSTHHEALDWMIPAPAQGILGVTFAKDGPLAEMLAPIVDPDTQLAASIERRLLDRLGGDCSLPLGGHLRMHEEEAHFEIALLSASGERICPLYYHLPRWLTDGLGDRAADELLKRWEGNLETV